MATTAGGGLRLASASIQRQRSPDFGRGSSAVAALRTAPEAPCVSEVSTGRGPRAELRAWSVHEHSAT